LIWLAGSLVAGIVAVALALTVGRWLPWILGLLDRVLAWLGFGTWSARVLTSIERRVAARFGRRRSPGCGRP
jgi:hypothetical protein